MAASNQVRSLSRLGKQLALLVILGTSPGLLTESATLFAHDTSGLGADHAPAGLPPVLEQARAAKRTASLQQATDAFSEAVKSWIVAGYLYEQAGSFGDAALAWTEAASLHEKQRQLSHQAKALIHLGYALQQIGQYQNAVVTLQSARRIAESQNNLGLLAATLGQLGKAQAVLENGNQALQLFIDALSLARREEETALVAVLLNDFGNALAAQGKVSDAIKAYTEGMFLARESGQFELSMTALINAAMASIDIGDLTHATERLEAAYHQLHELPDSHSKAFSLLNLALSYDDLYQRTKSDQDTPLQSLGREEHLLKEAIELATRIGDRTAESYALGYLGHLHEQAKRFPEALDWSRRAIFASQQINAPESLYRWHWQIGRILAATGKPEEAIDAYRLAVNTVQPIRHEFSGYQGRRHSFRESVGPVFYGLTDFLLKRAGATQDLKQQQDFLIQARDISEQYKTAELQDYFKDECVKSARSRATATGAIPKATAVIYPIVLPDRLELLVYIAGTWKRVSSPVNADRLTEEVRTFRQTLQDRTNRKYLPHSQQLYRWIVYPIEQELSAAKIDTLVFVPDGPLRTIPMSALHDGQEFLIRRFAFAVTPSMDLTELSSINRTDIRMLSVGITEAVQKFPALPHVKAELDALRLLYRGTFLIDQEFRVSAMRKELQVRPYSIVHIASHGKMESDAKSSFLLTYDGKITMDELSQLIGMSRFRKTPLDLLTLSACATAIGDDQAGLGLAGVAIKAGARSALASLWFIDDQATSELVGEFYRHLHNSIMSKAEALRQAQLKILSEPLYNHPSYWAPFLLINNWL